MKSKWLVMDNFFENLLFFMCIQSVFGRTITNSIMNYWRNSQWIPHFNTDRQGLLSSLFLEIHNYTTEFYNKKNEAWAG